MASGPTDAEGDRLARTVWEAFYALFRYDFKLALTTLREVSDAVIREPERRRAQAARLLWQAKHLCPRCNSSLGPWDAYCPGCATPNYRSWKHDRENEVLRPADPPEHRRDKRRPPR